MTEKRFMLDDTGELIDLNNHKFIDYGDECCNLLNELAEKNQQLKQEIKGFESCGHNWGLLYDEAKNKVEELSKENKELKIKNDLLSDELEQAKAVINKKWNEYLKKKGY